MRITTQMLNNTAKKSGLPFTCGTLLDQVNQNRTEADLLQILNQKNSGGSKAVQKQKQEKLKKEADNLQKQAGKFVTDKEGSLLDQFQAGGDNKEIYAGIEGMVAGWNNTQKELRALPGTLNDFYGQMLRQAAAENKDTLSAIGITVAKDGSLKLDSDKMKQADVESLKKVLGGSESFAEKAAFLASRISDNAEANMNSFSSQYNAAGDINSLLMNRYDFWG